GLSLDVHVDVDSGTMRSEAQSRLLLPDRRGSELAARAAGRAPALLQLPDPLAHLDSRGLPGSLPALPASAADRIQGPQVGLLRPGFVRRGMGPLLRADDGGSRLPARRAGEIGRASCRERVWQAEGEMC